MLTLKELKLEYITNEAGDRTAVVLPIEAFQELLENIKDLALEAERREEPTVSLEKVLAEVSRLPEQEQDTLAALISKELTSERRWEKSFSESGDALAALADEALAEHRGGRTQGLEPDKL